MDLEKYRTFTTEEFVLDNEFTEWVLRPDKSGDKFWAGFISACPDKNEQVKDAALIVKGMQAVEEEIPAARLDEILQRVTSRIAGRRKRIVVGLLRYAAVFAGIAVISSLLIFQKLKRDPFPLEPLRTEDIARGMVILSDGSSVGFNTRESVISQTASGELLINSDTVKKVTSGTKGGYPLSLNQVIIPYGKRSQVTLADGSHIWLNSGSRLSYPSEFSGKAREVYLSGEAFFDIAPDASKPFYVITKDIKIKVLGTRFNVSAYDDEEILQTVLLEGKVTIGKNVFLAGTEEMEPGERAVYHKISENFTKGPADVNYFTSWLYGYLIFENEPTPEIFKKLERYYNQPIVVENGLDNITFSGKLDLKEDIQEVLESITYSSRVKINREGDGYKVSR